MQKYKISSVDFDHNITFKGLYFWVGLTHCLSASDIYASEKHMWGSPLTKDSVI